LLLASEKEEGNWYEIVAEKTEWSSHEG